MKGSIPMCKACGRVKRYGIWGQISANQARKVKRYGINPSLCPSCNAIRIRVAQMRLRVSMDKKYADPIDAQAE